MSKIERKVFSGELKATGESGGAGPLVATFARFGVVDRDFDVTLASAIPDGQEVLFGSWNHSSVNGSVLPIGRGRIRNDGTRTQIVAEIFDTEDALTEYSVLKSLGPLAEFSYAFHVLDASTDYAELEQYPGARRILKELQVFEVSAVYAGAGIRTGIDSAKGILLAELGITAEWLSEVRRAGTVSLAELGFGGKPGLVRRADLEPVSRTHASDTSRYIDLRTI